MREVARIFDCNWQTVRYILINNNIKIKESVEVIKDKASIKVDQYDLKGIYIQTFNSMSDAARWLILNEFSICKDSSDLVNKISLCCKNKRQTAFKHKWKYHIEGVV